MTTKHKTLQKVYSIVKDKLDFPMVILFSLILVIIFFIALQSCEAVLHLPVIKPFQVQGNHLTDPCGETIILME